MHPDRKRRSPASVKKHRGSFRERLVNRKTILFLSLLSFAFCLNLIELEWGLSGHITWQPDSIEGEISINHMPLLFKQWRHKYPRGQYLLQWPFYAPLIQHWSRHPVIQQDPSGKTIHAVITTERARLLALISRWIVAVMSLGAIIAVFVLTKYLFGDYLSAWLAGLALSITGLFLFFSSIGHIDVPFMFWFAWAMFFGIRGAQRQHWLDHILAALCAGYAICTKEGYYAYVVSLAVIYCIVRIVEQYRQTQNVRQALLSVFTLKVLTAIAVFILLFVVMNGGLNIVREMTGRMQYWKNDPIFHVDRPHLTILLRSARVLYSGLGWPLLTIIASGIIYLAVRHPKWLAVLLVPLVLFYLFTVLRIRFVADRFFLPAYVGLAVLIGKTAADWVRFRKVPAWLRYSTLAVIGGLTVLYCVGMKLEMKRDTRNYAEAWFSENVSKETVIGSAMKRWYAPRLKYQGFRLVDGWHSEGIQTTQGTVKFFPEYLITSEVFPCGSNYKSDTAYKKLLYSGQGGYTQVARFRARYFSPSFSIFSVAAWPFKPVEWISPEVDVFQKNNSSAYFTQQD